MPLDAISIPPSSGQATGAVVILHGWGANAQDVAALATLLTLPHHHLLFPNAPFPYDHAPAGRVWYNFPEDYDFASRPDFDHQPELQESRRQLTEWLLSLEQTTGVPLDRTILGGFSQGGAMTLDVGLHLPLQALMSLSGYLHAPPPHAPTPPPLLMVHGRFDPVVPLTVARLTQKELMAIGARVCYEELEMGHEIPLIVLHLMQSFIENPEDFTGSMRDRS